MTERKFKVGDVIQDRRFKDHGPATVLEVNDSSYVVEFFGTKIQTSHKSIENECELVLRPDKISPHYTTDSTGKDYLQRFFENSTPEEVKGAMVFTMGKYIERLGKKDAVEKELGKIIDYATRYRDFLNK